MRTLSWILGIVALAATVFVAVSWRKAHVGIASAARATAVAEDALAEWQSANLLKRRNLRSAIENDELAIRNDELGVQIKDLQGKNTAEAQAQLRYDRGKLAIDEQTERFHDELREIAPDSNEEEAAERGAAARRSGRVYAGVADRDEKMAYACGVLWLAFGFAVALIQRRA